MRYISLFCGGLNDAYERHTIFYVVASVLNRMDGYLMGTSTSLGMPAPLCDCQYCDEIERRRPSLVVKKNKKTLLFDVSPDFREQTAIGNVTSIDSVFVTHRHHDHSTGLMDLYHTTRRPDLGSMPEKKEVFFDGYFNNGFDLYYSPITHEYLHEEIAYILDYDEIKINHIEDSDTVDIGELSVTSFISEHSQGYLGFIIEDQDKDETLVYNPDHGTLRTDVEFDDVDVLVADGGPLLGYKIHGVPNDAIEFMDTVGAETVYLTNVSEHTAQESTSVLRDRANEYDANIVSDGMQII